MLRLLFAYNMLDIPNTFDLVNLVSLVPMTAMQFPLNTNPLPNPPIADLYSPPVRI